MWCCDFTAVDGKSMHPRSHTFGQDFDILVILRLNLTFALRNAAIFGSFGVQFAEKQAGF
jgi:hypothetical protein